jgi:hypothetical protein
MYAKTLPSSNRHPRITAALAALILTVALEPATAQETPVQETAHDNCVIAMQAFPEQVPDPGAMCNCMIGEVSKRFSPTSADAVIGAMAAVSPDREPWIAWTQPPALKVAGALSQQDAEALSGAVQERLGAETQRQCAAATPADQAQTADPADGAPAPADAAEVCRSESCFTNHFRQCQPAIFTEYRANLGTLQIELLGTGESQPGNCRVRVWFTDHPDAEWINTPLSMTLQADAAFTSQYREGLETCLTATSKGAFDCTGPLRGIAK